MQKLESKEVIEAMIEYVRRYLCLDDMKGPDVNNQSAIFTGREIDGQTQFALEVVVKMHGRNGNLRSADIDFAKKRTAERSSPRKRDERVYTAVLFPKSIDYNRARIEFIGPYFRKPHLLSTADIDLRRKYRRFAFPNMRQLSRVEWEFAIPLSGNRVAYYNPQNGNLQVHSFRKLERHQVIPANVQLDKGYFWNFATDGFVPSESDPRRTAEVFRGIQEGLHDKVRMITSSIPLNLFTLQSYEAHGARVVPYDRQQSLFSNI